MPIIRNDLQINLAPDESNSSSSTNPNFNLYMEYWNDALINAFHDPVFIAYLIHKLDDFGKIFQENSTGSYGSIKSFLSKISSVSTVSDGTRCFIEQIPYEKRKDFIEMSFVGGVDMGRELDYVSAVIAYAPPQHQIDLIDWLKTEKVNGNALIYELADACVDYPKAGTRLIFILSDLINRTTNENLSELFPQVNDSFQSQFMCFSESDSPNQLANAEFDLSENNFQFDDWDYEDEEYFYVHKGEMMTQDGEDWCFDIEMDESSGKIDIKNGHYTGAHTTYGTMGTSTHHASSCDDGLRSSTNQYYNPRSRTIVSCGD